MSAPPVLRLLRLGGGATRSAGAGRCNHHQLLNEAAWLAHPAWLEPAVRLDGPRLAGDKAAHLAAAAAAGLAVLPGWVVPVAEGRPALSAGAAAVRDGRPAAARRAVLGHRMDDTLAAELRDAVAGLGGRVIVRSSSPLEADPRWSGAFSSVAEVGPGDVVAAVRSCWASAFAVDPLARLVACGLPLEALELGVLLQPEIRPVAGGVARVTPAAGAAGAEVTAEGVLGHPGALLSGWAEGASGPKLAALIGTATVAAVADLARRAWRRLGDDVIEWAAVDGEVWLLQSQRSSDVAHGAAAAERPPAARAPMPVTGNGAGALPTARASMPLLAAAVLRRGEHVPARPGAPGTAAGRLVAVRPHERPAGHCGDAILMVDRPVPALAPLLFAARGVIARTGAAGSHLAEVARSLGVPMVLGCRPERVTGTPAVPDGDFLAAIDGTTGDVALLPATGDWPVGRAESGFFPLSGQHHPASVRPVPGPSGQRI